MADRGYAAMPLDLDWGIEGEVFTVENADFQKIPCFILVMITVMKNEAFERFI